MHRHAFGEVRYPASAKKQLSDLISIGKVKIVDQSILSSADKAIANDIFDKEIWPLEKYSCER